jgi:hypothetical protein
MAGVADADHDARLGGTGLDHVAAGATNLGFHILRMNTVFHKMGREDTNENPTDKGYFE